MDTMIGWGRTKRGKYHHATYPTDPECGYFTSICTGRLCDIVGKIHRTEEPPGPMCPKCKKKLAERDYARPFIAEKWAHLDSMATEATDA